MFGYVVSILQMFREVSVQVECLTAQVAEVFTLVYPGVQWLRHRGPPPIGCVEAGWGTFYVLVIFHEPLKIFINLHFMAFFNMGF